MWLTHQANIYIQAIFSFWPIQVYPALYTTYALFAFYLYKIPDAGCSLYFGLIEMESTVIKINCSENKDGMFSLQIMHWAFSISIMPNSKCLFVTMVAGSRPKVWYFNGRPPKWELSVPLWEHIGSVRPVRLLPLCPRYRGDCRGNR